MSTTRITNAYLLAALNGMAASLDSRISALEAGIAAPIALTQPAKAKGAKKAAKKAKAVEHTGTALKQANRLAFIADATAQGHPEHDHRSTNQIAEAVLVHGGYLPTGWVISAYHTEKFLGTVETPVQIEVPVVVAEAVVAEAKPRPTRFRNQLGRLMSATQQAAIVADAEAKGLPVTQEVITLLSKGERSAKKIRKALGLDVPAVPAKAADVDGRGAALKVLLDAGWDAEQAEQALAVRFA